MWKLIADVKAKPYLGGIRLNKGDLVNPMYVKITYMIQ